MGDQGSYRELLYQYEILRTRLEIRQYYLQTAVKEVYENIGQVLSLIRMQLSLLQTDFKNKGEEKIEPSRQLIGKTIRDLRDMCHLFYPETEILSGQGFYRTVGKEIKNQYPDAIIVIDEARMKPVNSEKLLILFGVLLELLTLIRDVKKGRLESLTIKCVKNDIVFIFDYTGNVIKKDKIFGLGTPFNISIFERLELIGGRCQIRNENSDLKSIKLEISNNSTL